MTSVLMAPPALDEAGRRVVPMAGPGAADGRAFDCFGRRIDYLRISLTDRCNLRCVYCMPATGMHFAPRDELLTDDELLRLVRLTTELGFRKLRRGGPEYSTGHARCQTTGPARPTAAV